MHTDPLPYQLAELVSQVSRRHLRVGTVVMPGDMLSPSFRTQLVTAYNKVSFLPGLPTEAGFKVRGLQPKLLKAILRYPTLARFTKRVAALSLMSNDAPPLMLDKQVSLPAFRFGRPTDRVEITTRSNTVERLLLRDDPSAQFAWNQRESRFSFGVDLQKDKTNGQRLLITSGCNFGFQMRRPDDVGFRLDIALDPVLNTEQHRNAEGGSGLDLNSFIQFNLITMP